MIEPSMYEGVAWYVSNVFVDARTQLNISRHHIVNENCTVAKESTDNQSPKDIKWSAIPLPCSNFIFL